MKEVLPFFWLDVYEDATHQPGTVHLFGKVWVQEVHTHVRWELGCATAAMHMHLFTGCLRCS